VAVADAMPEVTRQVDYVLTRPGGRGAVRELCDLILKRVSI
jgi:3-deoxy-D-manno-octulosonate 8-phosphate phosphatase (KDO 8-P phosphatase)